ncbi:MAG: hypothetical protein MJ211_15485 [Bacteroidales bacterium]|nr:hypothetical protein [Bacteroidales bacterium]
MEIKNLKLGTTFYDIYQLSSLRQYLRDNIKVYLASSILDYYKNYYPPELSSIITSLNQSNQDMIVYKSQNTKTNAETNDENEKIAKIAYIISGIKATFKSKILLPFSQKFKQQREVALKLQNELGNFSLYDGTKSQNLGKIPFLLTLVSKFSDEDLELLELTEAVDEIKKIGGSLKTLTFNKSDKVSGNYGRKTEASKILFFDLKNFITAFNTINISLRGKFNSDAKYIEQCIKNANNSKRGKYNKENVADNEIEKNVDNNNNENVDNLND